MTRQLTVLVFGFSLAIACNRRIASDPEEPTFRTPEAAAFAAAWRDGLLGAPRPPVIINVPPDRRDLQSLLAQDLGNLFHPITVLRDSSDYARARVSEDQLRTWGRVYDIRRTRDSSAAVYEVRVQACRRFGCHNGYRVLVRSERSRYSARLLGYWEE